LHGHLAGDELLRTSAKCIKQCFGMEDLNNCYRIGGDEFVALLSKCSEQEVKDRIVNFENVLKENNISISVGYSYVEKREMASFVEMMAEADKKMYANKKSIHEQLNYTR
jgi:diguanylate cyclase (GGDEF)-like protein